MFENFGIIRCWWNVGLCVRNSVCIVGLVLLKLCLL